MECQVNANVAVDGMQWYRDGMRRRGARDAKLLAMGCHAMRMGCIV